MWIRLNDTKTSQMCTFTCFPYNMSKFERNPSTEPTAIISHDTANFAWATRFLKIERYCGNPNMLRVANVVN